MNRIQPAERLRDPCDIFHALVLGYAVVLGERGELDTSLAEKLGHENPPQTAVYENVR